MNGCEDVEHICKLKLGPIASWAQMALASAADGAAGQGCSGLLLHVSMPRFVCFLAFSLLFAEFRRYRFCLLPAIGSQ